MADVSSKSESLVGQGDSPRFCRRLDIEAIRICLDDAATSFHGPAWRVWLSRCWRRLGRLRFDDLLLVGHMMLLRPLQRALLPAASGEILA
ncbi:hypothetical protein AWC18_17945 [Mycolicibacter nonchromogenicus]|uniref:Uncharacterized protein n=1 Tax=Mycolicibacter nonchromogenicus TaxID=1782 RepID=A0A1X1YZN8_MYCNO|nr:hypothetical protein AWC18_17945 [Mycolicibacter nonchromogenicus]